MAYYFDGCGYNGGFVVCHVCVASAWWYWPWGFDVSMLEELIRYIMDLETKDFNEKFGKLQSDFENDMDVIENDTLKKVQDHGRCKNYRDLMYYVSDGQKELEKRQMEHFEDVKKFLIKWNQQKQ